MDSKTLKPMTPFDNLVTSPQVYALKLMLPYTPRSMQRMLGIFLKFTELKSALEHFYGFGSEEPSDILDTLKDCMGPEEQEMMEQMEMMMSMMEMMQNMPDMQETSDIQNMSGVPGMFQDMFGNMFHPSDNDSQKGESENE